MNNKSNYQKKSSTTTVKNNQKICLVTGGAGFLGSNLCAQLLNQGHIVIALDNFFTGRQENIYPFLSNKNFSFIEHDIINPLKIDYVDWIFNLACPASPPHYQKDPIYTTKISVIGALNMLELARTHNARILQASTSEVYGDPDVHPQPESYKGSVNPIGIRSCYDEGKRCAESLFFDYHRIHKTDIKVIRIFNTYGPNMDPNDGRVVSNFIIQALKNESITMYGNGTQTRSFCYVDDLIDGIVAMMNTDNTIIGPLNLGNDKEFNLLQLADLVIKLTGSSSTKTFNPLPSDDPRQRRPDLTMTKQTLNWKPIVQLEDGLQKTINYFSKIIVENNMKSENRSIEKIL